MSATRAYIHPIGGVSIYEYSVGGLFIVLRVFGDTSMKMNRTSPTLLLYYNAKLGDYEWHKNIIEL